MASNNPPRGGCPNPRDDGPPPLEDPAALIWDESLLEARRGGSFPTISRCNALKSKDNEGSTPLMSRDGIVRDDATSAIKEHDDERVNAKAHSPLHSANTAVHPSTGGTGATQTDNKGNTALHVAATGGSAKIVADLIDQGFDVNATNNDEDTPLHCAASGGYTNVVQVLKKRGANTSLMNKKGWTPKMVAISCSHQHLGAELP
eukprot:Selendium_serpulae@DN1756_c0_g1_i2.p1